MEWCIHEKTPCFLTWTVFRLTFNLIRFSVPCTCVLSPPPQVLQVIRRAAPEYDYIWTSNKQKIMMMSELNAKTNKLPLAWVFDRLRVLHALMSHRMVASLDVHALCESFRFLYDSWLLLVSHSRDFRHRARPHCVANLIQFAIQVVSPMPVMCHLLSDELSNADVWDDLVQLHLYHPIIHRNV